MPSRFSYYVNLKHDDYILKNLYPVLGWAGVMTI